MANCLFLFPNRSDMPKGAYRGATLSGPTWALPLENMQHRRLSKVAQSVDTNPANTFFNVAFNREHELRGLVLANTNLTTSAQVKITGWYNEGSYSNPIYQTISDAYPTLYVNEQPAWGEENFWDRKPLDEELEGFTQNFIHVLPEPLRCNNWRVEILDPANPDGYIRVGRLFMASGWQPSRNYALGGAHRYETDTVVEKSMSGAEYFDIKEGYRVATITFEYLDEQEALEQGLELQRRAGVHGEIFWLANPEDATNITRLSFLCRLRQLMPWEQVLLNRASIAFELKELQK